jgi:hypothetical protein
MYGNKFCNWGIENVYASFVLLINVLVQNRIVRLTEAQIYPNLQCYYITKFLHSKYIYIYNVGVGPLLCNDREMVGYTRAISGQQLGNMFPQQQTQTQL